MGTTILSKHKIKMCEFQFSQVIITANNKSGNSTKKNYINTCQMPYNRNKFTQKIETVQIDIHIHASYYHIIYFFGVFVSLHRHLQVAFSTVFPLSFYLLSLIFIAIQCAQRNL